jgi:glycosyltransferase involved in cell wall biosynthesis
MLNAVYDHQIFALQKHGGISRYFTEIAERIPGCAPIATHVIAPLYINEYLESSSAKTSGAFVRWRFRGAPRIQTAINRLLIAPMTRIAQPDLLHWTYYSPANFERGSRTVLTVYDMIHELFPGAFHPDDPTSRNKRRCVQRADHVVCISESTKRDLVRLFDTSPSKITVTPLACSPRFMCGPGPRESGFARPYILYVGHRSGYKGYESALRAYAASARLQNEFDFVCFGGFEFGPDEITLQKSLGLRSDAVRRLFGNDPDLARAYQHAHVFIYPSLYEGFGIPPLEAMASGCPVACSDTSSIPEVVGEAAELFDPSSIDAIRAALERVCFDRSRRARLVETGLRRAALFSWDRCAQETAAVYQKVVAS